MVELQIGGVAASELVWWSRSPPKHALIFPLIFPDVLSCVLWLLPHTGALSKHLIRAPRDPNMPREICRRSLRRPAGARVSAPPHHISSSPRLARASSLPHRPHLILASARASPLRPAAYPRPWGRRTPPLFPIGRILSPCRHPRLRSAPPPSDPAAPHPLVPAPDARLLLFPRRISSSPRPACASIRSAPPRRWSAFAPPRRAAGRPLAPAALPAGPTRGQSRAKPLFCGSVRAKWLQRAHFTGLWSQSRGRNTCLGALRSEPLVELEPSQRGPTQFLNLCHTTFYSLRPEYSRSFCLF
jgi:hypothetical protein